MQFGRCNWRRSAFFAQYTAPPSPFFMLLPLLPRLLCALVLLLSHQRVTVAELLRGRNARKKPCTGRPDLTGVLEELPAVSVRSACALVQLQSHCLSQSVSALPAPLPQLQSHWHLCLRLCKAVWRLCSACSAFQLFCLLFNGFKTVIKLHLNGVSTSIG